MVSIKTIHLPYDLRGFRVEVKEKHNEVKHGTTISGISLIGNDLGL